MEKELKSCPLGEVMNLIHGDCLEIMDILIKEGIKVDTIITDPPYQTTACKWDTLIPFNKHIMTTRGRSKKLIPMYEDEWIMRELERSHKNIRECREEFRDDCTEGMWDKLNKLIKPNGATVLFGQEPFSTMLRASNIKKFKYDWLWEKENGSNFATVKYQSFKVHEIISIFGDFPLSYTKSGGKNYNPQFEIGKPYSVKRKATQREQMRVGLHNETELKNEGTRYPRSIIKFNTVRGGFHKTQKPVALMEYLIKTYTNDGETILDFTMGSGTTGVACDNLKRYFIGIEKDDKYFKIAQERLGD